LGKLHDVVFKVNTGGVLGGVFEPELEEGARDGRSAAG